MAPSATPPERRRLKQAVETVVQIAKKIYLPSLAGIFFIVAFIAMTRPSRILLIDSDGTTTVLENPDRATIVWHLADRLGEGKMVTRIVIEAPLVEGALVLRNDPTYRLVLKVTDSQITLVDTHTDSRTGEPLAGKVTITKTLAGVLDENAEIALVSCPAKGEMRVLAACLSNCLPFFRITTQSGPAIAALPLIGRLFRRSATIEGRGTIEP